ncbi:haloacid dehalogenase type II [uncultured Enterococcus sp.]|uniref:haloacid dehalogenase type II n=1 Tax=uncultured Enterococcus sp. TaxID=167972 RepID=UPI0025FBB301|nr:haloacid dehalogenase type II [uncultured Enterococcus sp.]
MTKKPILVFDVNETLLDMQPVATILTGIFHRPDAFRLWFDQLLIYSETFALTKEPVSFSDMGKATLLMLADYYEVTLTKTEITEWQQAFASMPPYAEVPQALSALKQAGFKLVTLTNNPVSVQKQQLSHGAIEHYFEDFYSTQAVESVKPDPLTYHHVETALQVEPSDFMMVACHIWDTIGASKVGWQSCFIKRPNNALLPLGPQPDLVFDTLAEFATYMVNLYK